MPQDAITGALGYTGQAIAHRLLAQGRTILSLTHHPDRPNPFGERVRPIPYHFEQPDALTASLRGVDTLYNTYWVRFNYGRTTYEQAVAHTRTLFRAARAAGVRRIVHISITHADSTSPLPYFRGKGVLERDLRTLGLPYAILRPTVIFGEGDILINNIAYLLRRLPVFGVPGNGQYRLQPIYVEDLADLAVQAAQSTAPLEWDAVGPESYTYEALVRTIAAALGRRVRLIHLPPRVVYLASRLLGLLVRDVVLTWDEIRGLMANTLTSEQPPRGTTSFRAWLQAHADRLGRTYHSELRRHYR